MAILNTDVKNANVKFLNGLQSNVNTLITNGGAVKGAFYLTSDTHRLYIGQEDDTRSNIIVPVPVNEGVLTVASVSALPSPNTAEQGAFYYATAENILCVHNGRTWVQINPDTNTTVQYFYNTIVDSSDKTTLTYTLTDSTGNELSQGLDLVGANGINITSVSGANFNGTTFVPNATKRITITGDSYSLTGTTASNIATLTLASSDTNKTPSTVQIQGGSNIDITTENDKIVLKATDTYVNTISFTNKPANGNGFDLTATYNNNSNEIYSTFDPIVSINGTQDYHFVNGKATLPIYSKNEIDVLVRQLNSMTFKGLIGDNQLLTNVPDNTTVTISGTGGTIMYVSVGDTFKITTAKSVITGSNTSGTAGIGDLIIAQGTEYTTTDYENGTITNSALIGTINPATLYWGIVPSGDDTVTQISYKGVAIVGGLELQQSSDSRTIASLTAQGDNTYIQVNSANTGTGDNERSSQVLTIVHKLIDSAFTDQTIAATSATTQVPTRDLTIPVITSINRDAAGHVQNIEITNYVVKDTISRIGENGFNTNITTGGANDNYAKIDTSLTLVDAALGSEVSHQTASFVLESDTIQLSTATKTIGGTTYKATVADIVWGSF